ncbi:hypothetical protein A2J03_26365 [Rhodococcus sp. EPR-157]|nr:hypothetical protein A2J03_26365 [Rhodococcus sp. EPR-157]
MDSLFLSSQELRQNQSYNGCDADSARVSHLMNQYDNLRDFVARLHAIFCSPNWRAASFYRKKTP